MIEPDAAAMKQVQDKLNKVSVKLMDAHKNIQRSSEKRLVMSGNILRNKIIESMQNTTRADYFYTSGKNKNIKHYPSAPGSPPAVNTGELIAHIIYDVANWELKVGIAGGARYGLYLEKGSSRMKARPWLHPAANGPEFQNLIKSIGADVDEYFKSGEK